MTVGRRLRIAVLNRHFGKRFGGAEHYSAAIAEQLARHHEVHVFAQEIEHQHPGFHYHRVWRPLAKPRWLNQLWYALATWWLTRTGFDVVHSHENTWHGDIQTIHVRPFRIGLFHQRHGWRKALRWLSLITSPRLLSYWWLEWARMRPRPHRRIVATSDAVRAEILLAYPASAPGLETIPPGVAIPTAQADPQEMRLHLQLPESAPLALFVANDYEKKGLPTLLQAMVGLPKLHLAVVGNPKQQGGFEQQVRALGLEGRVHFLGALTDVGPAYDAADFLVHPTTEDTYAMVVLEAMAHGLPVVVSGPRYCGIAIDLIHRQQALILNDPRDAPMLIEQMSHLLSTPLLQQQLRMAGREFAHARSWQTVAGQYDSLLQKITQNMNGIHE